MFFSFFVSELSFLETRSLLSESVSTTSSTVYDVHNGDRRPAGLVRKFGDLYSMARLDTLDDLDSIGELRDANELKSKLLFSVVVVSVRIFGASLILYFQISVNFL